MYNNLKEGFDKYLESSGVLRDAPEAAKKILKHAWYDGATCVLKEFAKVYRQNPKAAIQLMQQLGQEGMGYDQHKSDLIKPMPAESEEYAPQSGQKHWGGWGRGWGGWGNWGNWGWPYYGGYGWSTGWPYGGWGWGWKDKYSAGHEDVHSPYYDPRPYEMEMPLSEYPTRRLHVHPRYMDGRMYDKDHPYSRMQREKYPDIEASQRHARYADPYGRYPEMDHEYREYQDWKRQREQQGQQQGPQPGQPGQYPNPPHDGRPR